MPDMKCTGEKCPIPELTKGATACTAHDCKHRTPPMPDIKEKMVELIAIGGFFSRSVDAEKCVDYLIANGVTIQECGGCEHCKADSDGFRKMFGAFSLVNPFHGKGWQIHAGKCKPREIHYCPMCGRKLSETPKGN